MSVPLGLRRRARCLAIASSFLAFATARESRADEVQWHLELGGAHAIGRPQGSEFGLGGGGALALELPLAKAIGVQLEGGALGLANGSAPTQVGILPHREGAMAFGMVGLRVHPLASSHVAGLWFDGNAGYAATGNLSRFAFDAHLGYDFRLGDPTTSRWDLGPYAGYTQIVQPNDSLRPNDAHILWVGAQLSLGRRAIPLRQERLDRDGDGVFDDEDACPAVPGVRTNDPKTNGCPRGDRDHDTIFDDEDACPDVAGIRTRDPKTNGCPRADRDNDTIFDDEDACPDVAGIRTRDPKTNGCPRTDRDNDTVFDDEDACPDVPGVRTEDPKTNGCPSSEGHVRVEGDRIVLDEVILFDTDAERVRHVSWPIVKKVAQFINATPDVLEVDIEGYADAVGAADHNLKLSRARAQSVKRLLIQYGVKPERLTTHAYGDTHPRVAVRKQEQANRRVEFTVTRAARGRGEIIPDTKPTPPAPPKGDSQ